MWGRVLHTVPSWKCLFSDLKEGSGLGVISLNDVGSPSEASAGPCFCLLG